MGWVTDSNKMLKRTAHHLTFINALVFILVLGVCATTVYALSVKRMEADTREDLQHLLTVLESSIETPGEDQDKDDDANDLPDVVQSDVRRGESERKPQETIQWFSPEGALLGEKGLLKIRLPLNKDATFQHQQNEHALVLTHLVSRGGRKLGYLRIGTPLSKNDVSKKNLLLDLIFGTLCATAVSGIAILWLVRQGLKPVEMSMQKLADFSADASHELHGPVMAIKTNGMVALKYPEGMRESDRQKILSMVDAANQMSTTIDALLRLAELEQTLPISELKQIQVNDLVKDICRELENLAASKSVEFNIEINDSNLSFTAVEADAKAALLNVLRNAIVYSRDEQRVNIKASKVGKFVQFQIEDFGIGIEANDLPRIFDRFWRSDKARSYRSGGKGLGLAITKSIVDRYNGTIGVESMPGKGSCVTVRFPEMPQ